ncbi:MAG: hypothetical protein GX825_06255, partial [Syntrophomonadaceae bacterium]|nr:hypothetical protein [Syntrophomonadaceae bacterium]
MRIKKNEIAKKASYINTKPRLGILSYTIGKKPRVPLSNFHELALAGKKRNISIIVFLPQDVDWSARKVNGWILEGEEGSAPKWKRSQLPLFTVVYNRIRNRKTERRTEVRDFFRDMEFRKIPYFNPSFLDKWTIWKWIRRDQEVGEHLPH